MEHWKCMEILVIFILTLSLQCQAAIEGRACYGETIKLTCKRGQSINVLRDYFGHSASYGCLRRGETNGCRIYTPGSRSPIKRFCNGRRDCEFKITEKPRCSDGKRSNFQHVLYECIDNQDVKDVCSDGEWLSKSGYLVTPNYPTKYPAGLDCACTLSSDGGRGWVGLTTFEFQLSETKPCMDWLFVTADSNNDKFCGSAEKSYRAKSLSFVFHTERESFKGFLLYFEAIRSARPISVHCNVLSSDGPSRIPQPTRQALSPATPRPRQALPPPPPRLRQALPSPPPRPRQVLPSPPPRPRQALPSPPLRPRQSLPSPPSRPRQTLTPASQWPRQPLPPVSERPRQALRPSSTKPRQALPPASTGPRQALPPTSVGSRTYSSREQRPKQRSRSRPKGGRGRVITEGDSRRTPPQRIQKSRGPISEPRSILPGKPARYTEETRNPPNRWAQPTPRPNSQQQPINARERDNQESDYYYADDNQPELTEEYPSTNRRRTSARKPVRTNRARNPPSRPGPTADVAQLPARGRSQRRPEAREQAILETRDQPNPDPKRLPQGRELPSSRPVRPATKRVQQSRRGNRNELSTTDILSDREPQEEQQVDELNRGQNTLKDAPRELKQTHNVVKDGKYLVASACFGEIINFECNNGEVIRIIDDFFGKSEENNCYHEENDCVLRAPSGQGVADQLCNGKTECHNLIVARRFCNQKITNYQQVTYECLKQNVFLDMGIQFKQSSQSGHLASPEFPNIHQGKVDTTCMLTATHGQVEITVAHLMLEQGKDCKEYLEVVSEKETVKLCKAGRQTYQAEGFILTFLADNDNGRSAVWLVYKGLVKDALVEIECNGNGNAGIEYDDDITSIDRPFTEPKSEIAPRPLPEKSTPVENIKVEVDEENVYRPKDPSERQKSNEMARPESVMEGLLMDAIFGDKSLKTGDLLVNPKNMLKPQEPLPTPAPPPQPQATPTTRRPPVRMFQPRTPSREMIFPAPPPVTTSSPKDVFKLSEARPVKTASLKNVPIYRPEIKVRARPSTVNDKKEDGLVSANLPSEIDDWLKVIEDQLAQSVPVDEKGSPIEPYVATMTPNKDDGFNKPKQQFNNPNQARVDVTKKITEIAHPSRGKMGENGPWSKTEPIRSSEVVKKVSKSYEQLEPVGNTFDGLFTDDFSNTRYENMEPISPEKNDFPPSYDIGQLSMIEVLEEHQQDEDQRRVVISNSLESQKSPQPVPQRPPAPIPVRPIPVETFPLQPIQAKPETGRTPTMKVNNENINPSTFIKEKEKTSPYFPTKTTFLSPPLPEMPASQRSPPQPPAAAMPTKEQTIPTFENFNPGLDFFSQFTFDNEQLSDEVEQIISPPIKDTESDVSPTMNVGGYKTPEPKDAEPKPDLNSKEQSYDFQDFLPSPTRFTLGSENDKKGMFIPSNSYEDFFMQSKDDVDAEDTDDIMPDTGVKASSFSDDIKPYTDPITNVNSADDSKAYTIPMMSSSAADVTPYSDPMEVVSAGNTKADTDPIPSSSAQDIESYTELMKSSSAQPSPTPEYQPTTTELDFDTSEFTRPSQAGNTIIGEQNINIGTLIEAPIGYEKDKMGSTLKETLSDANIDSLFPSYADGFHNYDFESTGYRSFEEEVVNEKDDKIDDAVEFLYPSYLGDKDGEENYEYTDSGKGTSKLYQPLTILPFAISLILLCECT